jgi:hypothetical protein
MNPPSGVVGPKTNNVATYANYSTYENQVAGYNCLGSTASYCPVNSRKWDRGYDTGNDFRYYNAPVTWTPAPTAPPATPVKTPAKKVIPAAPANGSAATPTPSAAASAVPAKLSAVISKDNASVNLSWDPVDGATPVLERSVNKDDWVSLPVGATAKTYADADVYAGSKYYYRLSFKGSQGSDYALAEIIMPDVLGASTNAPAPSVSTKAGSGGISPVILYGAAIVIVLGVLLALAFLPIIPAKIGRKSSYSEYLHSKYLNL